MQTPVPKIVYKDGTMIHLFTKIFPWIALLIFSFQGIAKQKNVLFIAIDDLKPLLNCYGHTEVLSPHIDSLAEDGTTFLNAHCQQAVCGPYRVSLLTGYYPDTIGIYGMGSDKYKLRPKHPDILTLPQYFKNNGYTTVGTGKIFDPRNVEGDWHGPQDKISWTRFFGKNPYNSKVGAPKIDGHYHDPKLISLTNKLKNEAKSKGLKGKQLREYVRANGAGPAVESYAVPDDAYKDGATTERALEQIETLAENSNPFFLAVGFTKPHLPFVAPKKYWDLYDRDEIKLAPFQNYPEGAPPCAQTDYIEARTYGGVPEKGKISSSIQKELIHGYLACVSYVDAQVGKIIQKLKDEKLYKETIIVLWGDHGFHLGDKEIWGKHTNYEESTRSPLIVSNASADPGSKNTSPVNLIDIFPTLNDLCSLESLEGLDGKSLKPILDGRSDSVQKFAASIYPHSGYWGIAIRTDNHRYISWHKGKSTNEYHGLRFKSEPAFVELYDYSKDPLEQKNLVDSIEYKGIKQELVALSKDHIEFTQSKQFKK